MAINEKKKGSNTITAAMISSVISFHLCTPIYASVRINIYRYVRAIDHIVLQTAGTGTV